MHMCVVMGCCGCCRQTAVLLDVGHPPAHQVVLKQVIYGDWGWRGKRHIVVVLGVGNVARYCRCCGYLGGEITHTHHLLLRHCSLVVLHLWLRRLLEGRKHSKRGVSKSISRGKHCVSKRYRWRLNELLILTADVGLTFDFLGRQSHKLIIRHPHILARLTLTSVRRNEGPQPPALIDESIFILKLLDETIEPGLAHTNPVPF